MVLEARLSPLVFSELYRQLSEREHLSQDLAERLNSVDLDISWLNEARDMYEEKWNSLRGQYLLSDDAQALTNDHALFASWLLAPLLFNELCSDIDQYLRRTVTERAITEGQELAGPPPDAFRPVVSNWQVGQAIGAIDLLLPVALPYQPKDLNVQAAYRGLVEHVLHLEKQEQPWPELIGTATLWRSTGLAEGLRPSARDAQEAIKELLSECRRTLPEHEAERISKHFSSITDYRNALSHVKDLVGKPRFQELTGVADEWQKIRLTVSGVTHFYCALAARELATESSGIVYANFWQNLEYELQIW